MVNQHPLTLNKQASCNRKYEAVTKSKTEIMEKNAQQTQKSNWPDRNEI